MDVSTLVLEADTLPTGDVDVPLCGKLRVVSALRLEAYGAPKTGHVHAVGAGPARGGPLRKRHDVDGAWLPVEVVEIIREHHGRRVKFLRSRRAFTTPCHTLRSPVVYAYAGVRLVAVISPLTDSPCVRRIRGKRARP